MPNNARKVSPRGGDKIWGQESCSVARCCLTRLAQRVLTLHLNKAAMLTAASGSPTYPWPVPQWFRTITQLQQYHKSLRHIRKAFRVTLGYLMFPFVPELSFHQYSRAVPPWLGNITKLRKYTKYHKSQISQSFGNITKL